MENCLPKILILKTVKTSFCKAPKLMLTAIKWSWYGILIFMAAYLAPPALEEFMHARFMITFLSLPLTLIIIRLVILKEATPEPYYKWFGKSSFWYSLLFSIAIFLALMMVAGISLNLPFLIHKILPFKPLISALFYILPTIFLTFLAFFAARFSQILPLAAINHPNIVENSWQMTEGNTLRIIAVFVLNTLFSSVLLLATPLALDLIPAFFGYEINQPYKNLINFAPIMLAAIFSVIVNGLALGLVFRQLPTPQITKTNQLLEINL